MTRLLTLVATLSLFAPCPSAAAQTAPADPAFAALDTRLKAGDSVTVTGPDLGTIRGRLVGLAPPP